MVALLKLFIKGILTTLMLPVILLVWVLYGVYCFVAFIIMFFVNVVEFFQGKNSGGELIEDLEARKMLLEQEKADEQLKAAANMMYQNALAQAQYNQQTNTNPTPITPVQPYGMENFGQPRPEMQQEQTTQEQSSSLEDSGENHEDFDAR